MEEQKSNRIELIVEIGQTATLREQPKIIDGVKHTHDWEVFIKGAGNNQIEQCIEKVVFNLHETVANPERQVRRPPFVVRDTGYGSFFIKIRFFFQTTEKNFRETKSEYELILPSANPKDDGYTKELKFKRPIRMWFEPKTDDFRAKLLKSGGKIVPALKTPAVITSSKEKEKQREKDKSKSRDKEKEKEREKDKEKERRDKDSERRKERDRKEKEEKRKVEEKPKPKPTNDFANLFGTPINKNEMKKDGKDKEKDKDKDKADKDKDRDKPRDKEREKKDRDKDRSKDSSKSKDDKSDRHSSSSKSSSSRHHSSSKSRKSSRSPTRDSSKKDDKRRREESSSSSSKDKDKKKREEDKTKDK